MRIRRYRKWTVIHDVYLGFRKLKVIIKCNYWNQPTVYCTNSNLNFRVGTLVDSTDKGVGVRSVGGIFTRGHRRFPGVVLSHSPIRVDRVHDLLSVVGTSVSPLTTTVKVHSL